MLRRIVLVLIAILLTGFAISYLLEQGLMRVARIDVVEEDTASEEYLFKKIKEELDQKFKVFKGQWIWHLDLDQLLSLIEADKRVRSAHVTRSFPNHLKVVITPHKPKIAVLSPTGEILPISPDASLLPAVSENEAPDFPILRGPVFFSSMELRASALALIDELPESGLFSRQKISEVKFSKANGFSLILSESGVEVKMGEGDIGRKASRVEKVLNYLDKQKIEGRVIDARFNKKVVVRLRDAP